MGVDLNAGKSGKGATPDINVTPLVDVVLVLLIIFMVVIPNVQDGKSIELFKTKVAKAADSEEPDKTIITIDAKEHYFVADQEVSRAELLSALDAAAAAEPGLPVLIRGDVSVPYRVVREVFREAQQRGVVGVKLAVGRQKQGFDE
ncbi:MAG: biopolymer transporter ExbD [Myxococcales bacterium FL481]|nr:MAG: biopolymer transporter ExbD [Myxococcales bacterium FL481]